MNPRKNEPDSLADEENPTLPPGATGRIETIFITLLPNELAVPCGNSTCSEVMFCILPEGADLPTNPLLAWCSRECYEMYDERRARENQPTGNEPAPPAEQS